MSSSGIHDWQKARVTIKESPTSLEIGAGEILALEQQ